jgi:FlaA1/EpsC-like NDP-sugar epimerase
MSALPHAAALPVSDLEIDVLGPLPDAPPGVLPKTGVVLIGTPATIRQMATGLGELDTPCVVTGCIGLDTFAIGRQEAGRGEGALPQLLGTIADLASIHARRRITLALVSVPSDRASAAARVLDALDRLSIPHRVVPTIHDSLRGVVAQRPLPTPRARLAITEQSPAASKPARDANIVSSPRAIDITRLIGRSQARLDEDAIARIITGKRVLITGAGGSIGAELARVCARFSPQKLLLMERAENALFQIDHEMGSRFASIPRQAILHDVNDADQTLRLMLEYRPHVVFHSAAHKHVPLMEDHPALAVGNNLFATKSIADASIASGVERFVMISSDKAVNPSSVMGATKRLAELYIAGIARAHSGPTRLSMVRFGNVLASACSVIPIWSQQLADAGPLSVTDPRMTRYFMTIPEAAALVVQAGALDQPAQRAPVYVLDMGRPISILRLAQRFARLNGYAPRVRWTPELAALIRNTPASPEDQLADDDLDSTGDGPASVQSVDIVFTGVRPGEKLFEQLAYDAEQLAPTAHSAINQWSSPEPEAADPSDALRLVADMMPYRSAGAEKRAVIDAIRRWVPEMTGGSAPGGSAPGGSASSRPS